MRSSILTLAVLLLLHAAAAAATTRDDSDELRLKKVRVVITNQHPDGRYEFTVTADIKNVGTATWESATATIDAIRAAKAGVEVVGDPQLEFGPIDPRQKVSARDTITLLGPRRVLKKALRTAGKAKKSIFEVRGVEIVIYDGHAGYLTDETDEAFTGIVDLIPGDRRRTLFFSGWTDLLRSLTPDHILLPNIHEVENTWRTGAWHRPVVHVPRDYLPAEVVGVTEVNGTVEVEIVTRDLLDVVESGSFRVRADYAPEGKGHTTFAEETPSMLFFTVQMAGCEDESINAPSGTGEEPEECGFKALPIRFNDVPIRDGLFVSGELLLQVATVEVDVRIRRFRLEKATADLGVGWSTTLEVRAEGDVSFDSGELSLFEMPLAVYTLFLGPVPITISPTVEMKLGASADLKAGAVFSVHQRGTVGMVVGWDDGRYLAEPYDDIEPLDFTPPRLTDDTKADGRAWAAMALAVKINGSAGPYVEARVFGDLKVRPNRKNWWTVETGAEVVGGFELSILGLDIAHWETKLFGGEGPADTADRGDPKRTSGETTRWALALTDGAGSGGHQGQKVIPLADGCVLVTGRNTTAGYLIKLDAVGTVLWEKELPQGTFPVGAAELPNGHLRLAGAKGSSIWVAEHDAAGERIWFNSIETDPVCQPMDMALFVDTNSGNDTLWLVVGRATIGTIRERDPCVIRFDETGGVVWAKRYESPGAEWANAVVIQDGQTAVIGGVTDAHDEHPGDDGLLMTIDELGGVPWAQAIGTDGGAHLEDVITTEEGRIFATGTNQRTVNRDHPTLWLLRAEADGKGIRNLLLEQNWEYEELLEPGGAPIDSGNTAYDTGYGLARVPGGIVVVGSNGLGDARRAWTAKLNDDLGVIWMTEFDGSLADIPGAVAHAGDGIVMVGASRSFAGADQSMFVAKLPHEGRIRFLPELAVPSLYLPPSTKSGDAGIMSNGKVVEVIQGTVAITFTVTDLVVNSGTAPTAPTAVTSTVTPLAE